MSGIGDALTSPVEVGIALGLVVGAPLGGILVAWLSVRAGGARVPDGLDWPAIAAVAPLKGIGVTVAIFISLLAFDDPVSQEQAKLAILFASFVAGVDRVGRIASEAPAGPVMPSWSNGHQPVRFSRRTTLSRSPRS